MDLTARYNLLGIVAPQTRVFNMQEACALMAIGENTLRDMLVRGEIKGHKIPNRHHGRWHISESAMQAYLRQAEQVN